MKEDLTFGIIKPDAVAKGRIGAILTMIEESGLQVVGLRQLSTNQPCWEEFYTEHQGKPFYNDLVTFMSSGSVVVLALRGEDAVARWRKLMGATDSAKAEPGTIRALYGNPLVMRENAVHGSDSAASARRELAFFAPQ